MHSVSTKVKHSGILFEKRLWVLALTCLLASVFLTTSCCGQLGHPMSPMDALHPTNWLSELKDGNNNLDCVWTPALNVHRVSRERKDGSLY